MIDTIDLIACIILSLTFSTLGIFITFLHIPKSEDLKYYRYSRITLGIAFFIMAFYCAIRPIITSNTDRFTDFSFQMLFYLLFSWLTYSAFLFLIYTERFKRRKFFLDGAIPTVLMLVSAMLGLKFSHLQEINSVIFGVIFGGKCIWMASNCLREYTKCTKDLDNYYENAPDLRWMSILLWITMILSVLTIVHFYVPSTHIIYYPLFIITYFFMTMKMINYLPVRISHLRKESVKSEEEVQEKKKTPTDLKEKLEPSVQKWIEQKKFTHPELTIKDVASEIGTNHNYLSKYINSVQGMTFSTWLHTLRIEESKVHLCAPEKISIEEVGRRVGIPELYNFSRWFKTITGLTPQQFRKSNTNK
ncbi:MAG: helix-turn-helix transcriptional regulator [Bacteroidales bacterium]|nr:helix-turn-helix transcriptional regulator [Bacteroidales bacterium]